MIEMWVSNFRLESIVTPKYLTLFLREIGEMFIEISIAGNDLLSFGGVINAWDFEGFTVSKLALNQPDILSRSLLI